MTAQTHTHTATSSISTQHVNTETPMLPYHNDILSFDAFHNAIVHFRRFQADPANRPTYDPKYGTKYPGKLTHLHYAFYALLRGKSPEITSHDTDALSHQSIHQTLIRMGNGNASAPDALQRAFGLSGRQIQHAITVRREQGLL